MKTTNKFTVRGHALRVFETRITEIASDPAAYGLDAAEARRYKLAADLFDGRHFSIPDDADDRYDLFSLFTDIANCEDHDACERTLDPATRRGARHARDGIQKLAGALLGPHGTLP